MSNNNTDNTNINTNFLQSIIGKPWVPPQKVMEKSEQKKQEQIIKKMKKDKQKNDKKIENKKYYNKNIDKKKQTRSINYANHKELQSKFTKFVETILTKKGTFISYNKEKTVKFELIITPVKKNDKK